jgi:PRTRC genetic system protein C
MHPGVVIEREFNFNGVRMPDPDKNLSPEEVRAVLSTIYPDIATASITGPEPVGNKLVYRFSRAIEIRGAFAFFLLPSIASLLPFNTAFC